MRMETALASASWTRVERRNPYNLKNKMKMGDLRHWRRASIGRHTIERPGFRISKS